MFLQEEADRKRRTEFKRYEMEKKFEHEQVTKQFQNLTFSIMIYTFKLGCFIDCQILSWPSKTDQLIGSMLQRLQHIEDEEKRKEEEHRMDEREKKHREHSKVNHPMTKDQLEGVWEDQVSILFIYESWD